MTSGTLSSFVPEVFLTCVRGVLLIETRRQPPECQPTVLL
jgi:hypothetical protein